MEEKKKQPKKRADKYDTKVAVKGTLEMMIAAAVKPKRKEERKEK